MPEIADVCDFDVVQPMNIDSTNMRPADWMRIRDEIVDAYDAYDGFVVLHGTDTMAYTAAALSYLVQGSPKPIVLTGSQQPMASPFTDAKLNLYQSLLFAADDRSCDVSVVFGGAVIAGTRARKQRTMSFDAFTSVNFPEIALVRGERIVRAGSPATCAGVGGAPRVYDSLNERVFVLKLTPEMNPSIFDLLKRDYDAVILETFGIGGIPDYGDYRRAIFGWVDSGRTLVVTTQVPEEGCDLGVYEVGRVQDMAGGHDAPGAHRRERRRAGHRRRHRRCDVHRGAREASAPYPVHRSRGRDAGRGPHALCGRQGRGRTG